MPYPIYKSTNYFFQWMEFEVVDGLFNTKHVKSTNTPEMISAMVDHGVEIPKIIDNAIEKYYNGCKEFEYLVSHVKEGGIFGNCYVTLKSMKRRNFTSREIRELENNYDVVVMNIVPLHGED